MNTAETNVAMSAATMLNMAQVAVDVARVLSGRTTKEALQERATFVMLKDTGSLSSEFLDMEPRADGATGATIRIVDDGENNESSIPFQIATDLMSRQVTSLVKLK